MTEQRVARKVKLLCTKVCLGDIDAVSFLFFHLTKTGDKEPQIVQHCHLHTEQLSVPYGRPRTGVPDRSSRFLWVYLWMIGHNSVNIFSAALHLVSCSQWSYFQLEEWTLTLQMWRWQCWFTCPRSTKLSLLLKHPCGKQRNQAELIS